MVQYRYCLLADLYEAEYMRQPVLLGTEVLLVKLGIGSMSEST
ncbi:hypothetical protein FORC64_2710 [Escherichia coli]|nr:hypothetical protein FORC64_2710 [Escherichia coli]